MNTTRNIAFIALFTALLCVLAPLAIPIGPVPITLATLAVYIIGALLDVKRAPICVVLYILIGMMGVPVFSSFQAGLAPLAGPTAGFIYGYIVGIIAESLLITWKKDKFWIYPLGMILATFFIYAFGLAWYLIYCNVSGNPKAFAAALMACVVPFLPGDACKIVCGTLVTFKLRKPLDKALSIPTKHTA